MGGSVFQQRTACCANYIILLFYGFALFPVGVGCQSLSSYVLSFERLGFILQIW